MALTVERKKALLALARRECTYPDRLRVLRPMLVCENGRVVRDVDVDVGFYDPNSGSHNETRLGFRVKVRRDDYKERE